MNKHDYYENYDMDLEIHKLKRQDSFTEEKITTKDMVKITLGALLFAPVLYFGTIGFMAMIYAVTGVR